MKPSVRFTNDADELFLPTTSVPSGVFRLVLTEFNYVGRAAVGARKAAGRQRDYWRSTCAACGESRHYLEFMRLLSPSPPGEKALMEQQSRCLRCAPPTPARLTFGEFYMVERRRKNGTVVREPRRDLALGFGRWTDDDMNPRWFMREGDDACGRAQMVEVWSEELETRKMHPLEEHGVDPETLAFTGCGERIGKPLEVRLQPYADRKLQAERVRQELEGRVSPASAEAGRRVRV